MLVFYTFFSVISFSNNYNFAHFINVGDVLHLLSQCLLVFGLGNNGDNEFSSEGALKMASKLITGFNSFLASCFPLGGVEDQGGWQDLGVGELIEVDDLLV